MPQHRRRRVGLLVRRSAYLSLWRQYQELLRAYRAQQTDLQTVLEDHEGLLSDLDATGPMEEIPAPEGSPHVPSWAETEPIPVITSLGDGLDVDKASALVRNTGMLDGAGFRAGQPGTTG
jgi:hypothetical protein